METILLWANHSDITWVTLSKLPNGIKLILLAERVMIETFRGKPLGTVVKSLKEHSAACWLDLSEQKHCSGHASPVVKIAVIHKVKQRRFVAAIFCSC